MLRYVRIDWQIILLLLVFVKTDILLKKRTDFKNISIIPLVAPFQAI